jgi:hypothetical protein
MNINDAFPSKWLTAGDLRGQDVPVTIRDVRMELVGQPPENCPVVYFAGKEKALVLNKTNGQTIADQLGPDTDHWLGKPITIFPTSTDFQGRQVACIRVRPGNLYGRTQPATNGYHVDAPLPTMPPAGPADLDDEIPF